LRLRIVKGTGGAQKSGVPPQEKRVEKKKKLRTGKARVTSTNGDKRRKPKGTNSRSKAPRKRKKIMERKRFHSESRSPESVKLRKAHQGANSRRKVEKKPSRQENHKSRVKRVVKVSPDSEGGAKIPISLELFKRQKGLTLKRVSGRRGEAM